MNNIEQDFANELESAIDDLSHLVDETTVANYLQDNPDFFIHNPQLLTQLKLPTVQQGTISLVERQQQLMREKIHSLEDEITSLMAIASHNQQLYKQFSQLYFKLLGCESITQLSETLAADFIDTLGMSKVEIKLYQPDVPAKFRCQRSSLDNILVQRLDKSQCYFGRINQQEQQLLFSEQWPGSVALIALGKYGETGLLAVASDDPNHFEPNMDNLMLMQLCRLFSSLVDSLDV